MAASHDLHLLARYFGRAMATFANQGLQTSRSEATSVGQKLVQGAQKYGFKQAELSPDLALLPQPVKTFNARPSGKGF